MEASEPHAFNIDALIEPYPESVRNAFVAYLYLLVGAPSEIHPNYQRRVECFARELGLRAEASQEERQTLVDEHFRRTPLPEPLIAELVSFEASAEGRAHDLIRTAASQMAGTPPAMAPPTRTRGAPPGGHLNLLIARAFVGNSR